MPRKSRRKSKDKGRAAGFIYGAIGVAIIASIAATGGYLAFNRRDTDRLTGCPVDRYEDVTAVLVDLTDPISPTQSAALRNALVRIRDGVPKFGRLEIYPLRSTKQSVIDPLFAGCSPGSGKDVDSRLYGNPELADRLWHRQFADKLTRVIAEIERQPQSQESPILEAIQSIAVTAFGEPLALAAKKKRLVVVSDMIHYTPELSLYRSTPQFDRFKNSQYFLRVKPSLRGADVDVFLIVRETERNVQQPPLYKFWVDYATAGGGFLRAWEPLQ